MKDLIKINQNHMINGTWLEGSGEPFKSYNPADGSICWQGRQATQAEINAAVAAAKKVSPHGKL